MSEDLSVLLAEREQTPEEALEAFREALAELGLTQRQLAVRMMAIGDRRKFDAILRAIQRMAAGEARVSGEMQVVLALLRRERRAAKRLADTIAWEVADDRVVRAEYRGVRLTLSPQTRGRWQVHARYGADGYSPPIPHWRDSLAEAKIRAVLAVEETLDQMVPPLTPVTVHRFKVYDITIDDYRYPGAMAPQEVIARIPGAEVIEGTGIVVDEVHLDGNRLFNASAKAAATA